MFLTLSMKNVDIEEIGAPGQVDLENSRVMLIEGGKIWQFALAS